MKRTFGSVLITGASSGLGAALAHSCAAQGVTLHLGARRAELLQSVAADCRARGGDVTVQAIDVTLGADVAEWVVECHRQRPLDLVIANAGISGGTSGGMESDEQVRRIFSVNVDGVLNTVLPALALMRRQGSGQIGIMASLAGHRGFPGAPAYCGSKAAVKVWGEGLRGEVAGEGVGVSVIMPGFVATPMTDVNDFAMPFLMSPARAARVILDGLAHNRPRIAFPWPTATVAWMLGALSPVLTDWLLGHAPKKR